MNFRTFRRFLGILILLISLGLLIWGLWPVEMATQTLPIGPENMQLPTPTSLLLIWALL